MTTSTCEVTPLQQPIVPVERIKFQYQPKTIALGARFSTSNRQDAKVVFMRVAFVSESFLPSINGVTNSVLRVLEHLRRQGDEAIVIVPEHPDGTPDTYAGFPVYGTPSLSLPWYPELRLSTTSNRTVKKILLQFGPDVVHLAAPFALGNSGMQAANKLGIPTVALYQTEVPKYVASYGYPAAEPFFWRLVKRMHNSATLTLAPSTATQQQLIDRGFERVKVWGRGVDSERFHPNKRSHQLHEEWAPNGETVVAYMGRLGREKQVSDLAVLSDIPGVKLVIIGDGPKRDELQQQLPGAIFTGMKTGEDLPIHLASADIFVHPGETETFGQTLQEAQASGLAVVATGRGGPIDIVADGVNGRLYPPGNLDALRQYVADLVADEHKRKIFGAAGRARAEQRSWEKLCDQLLDYYREAISARARV